MGYKFIIDKDSDSQLYFTKFGQCSINVKKYIDKVTELGFLLTQVQFNAINDFYNNIIRLKVESKILEIYPLIGNNIDSFCTKLKYIREQNLIPMNGFSVSRLENINGIYIGKDNTTYSASNTPYLDTKIKVSDLNHDWNVSALVGADISPTTGGGKYLLGASQIDDARTYTACGFETFSSTLGSNIGNSSSVSRNTIINQSGIYTWNTDFYAGRVSLNGDRILSFGSLPIVNIGNDVELSLFARKGYGTNSTLTPGITQKVRFVVISKGLTIPEIKNLTYEINMICNKLGKSFI